MGRLVISLLFLSCTLQATPFVFTTCSAGTTVATPCPIFGLNGPGYEVMAQATATEGPQTSGIAGFPDLPGAQQQSAITHAEAAIEGPVILPLSGNAQASDTVMYASFGAVRSGFIQLEVAFDYTRQDIEGAASALFTDGVNEYSYIGGGGIHGSTPPSHCFIDDCEYIATVPFDLGTQFQVSVAGHAGAAATTLGGNGRDGSGQVLFRLLEANGTTVVPFAAVPEPTSGAMLLIAATIGACFARRQRRSRRN